MFQRIASVTFICVYLSSLGYGLFCHTLQWNTANHPLMYYVVWDMFCGWTSYASRTHIIAEGESETFYRLSPTPWGDFHPWGRWGRENYDPFYNHVGRLARTTLRYTKHEPITRVFVVEECWAKKFDLPDAIWKTRYDDPKDLQTYTHLVAELTPEGKTIRFAGPWLTWVNMATFADNPRLQAEAQRTRPLFVMEGMQANRNVSSPMMERMQPRAHAVGSPLGN